MILVCWLKNFSPIISQGKIFGPSLLSIYKLQKTRLKNLPCEMMDEKYFIIFLNLYREFFSNATFGTWKKSGIVTKVASLVTRHDDIATSDKCQGTEQTWAPGTKTKACHIWTTVAITHPPKAWRMNSTNPRTDSPMLGPATLPLARGSARPVEHQVPGISLRTAQRSPCAVAAATERDILVRLASPVPTQMT